MSGNTGARTTGHHLHWSVLQGESGLWSTSAINPAGYLYTCQNPENPDTDPDNPGTNPDSDEDYFAITCYPYDYVGPVSYIDKQNRNLCYEQSSQDMDIDIELSEAQIAAMIDWKDFYVPPEIDNYLNQHAINFKAGIVKCALIDQPQEPGNWLEKVRQDISNLAGFVPLAGDLGDMFISATGRNLLTGKQASCLERYISGIFGGLGVAADLVGTSGAVVGSFFTSFGTEMVEKGIIKAIREVMENFAQNLTNIQLKVIIKETIETGLKNGRFFIDNISGGIKHLVKVGNDIASFDPANFTVKSLALINGKAVAKVGGKKVVGKSFKEIAKKLAKNLPDDRLQHIIHQHSFDSLTTKTKFLKDVDIKSLIEEAKRIINTTDNFKSTATNIPGRINVEVNFVKQIGTDDKGNGAMHILQISLDEQTGDIITAFPRKNSQIF